MRVIREISFSLCETLDSSSREAQATKQSRFACRVGVEDWLALSCPRHCERSEAIQTVAGLLCRVLLAMTGRELFRGPHRHRLKFCKIPAAAGGGFQQRAGIGLSRMGKDLRRRALFDDAAMLHHGTIDANL